ncbi:glycosyltransferase family 4 protein [Bacteroides ovatus]|uniref:glycosyltransferase family 4 protein n=1 Tax=Bacteroides ovatus TaxID=28116 RepID=UPI001106C6D3|nr:glycosyltransferase family 4 protein [Bacteroides ovatus]
MKYGIIQPSYAMTSNSGVMVQCKMWAEGLRNLGHEVSLINFWNKNDWEKYDAIIVVSFSLGLRVLIRDLFKNNSNLIIAPIIDPDIPAWRYKFYCKWWGNQKYLGLTSRFHDLWLSKDWFKLWLIRSEEERYYTHYCLERPQKMIKKVPLHFRIPPIEEMPSKEKFCFHASRLASANKNVPRLIEAAKKYGFNLKLAGYLHGMSEENWLKSLIGDAPNIEYVGEVSEQELQDLYKRAKVFALPSLQEGVGMVALEAAAYGCEIVLTNYGAPKEYYEGRATLVNPYDINEIGRAVMNAMNNGYAQPELMHYVNENYSAEACCKLLDKYIQEFVSQK